MLANTKTATTLLSVWSATRFTILLYHHSHILLFPLSAVAGCSSLRLKDLFRSLHILLKLSFLSFPPFDPSHMVTNEPFRNDRHNPPHSNSRCSAESWTPLVAKVVTRKGIFICSFPSIQHHIFFVAGPFLIEVGTLIQNRYCWFCERGSGR